MVVVLCWNGRDDTSACLDSVLRLEYPNRRVVVVDNGSSDDTVAMVRTHFPWVGIVENGQNLGYAGGNNVGIKYALGEKIEYVFVLNNDTVLDRGCVTELVADLETHPQAAAAAPKSYFFDAPETLYFAGGKIKPDGDTVHLGAGETDGPAFGASCETEWLTGCAIMFRADALIKVGLFHPDYFLVYEDSDWSLRARRAGFELRFAAQAKLWHKVSRSFGNNGSPFYFYYYTRNACLWIERNHPLAQRPRLMYRAVRRAVRYATLADGTVLADDRYRARRAVWHGLSDYLLRRFGQRNYGW
jgi:GT2 family glycosyltransferase